MNKYLIDSFISLTSEDTLYEIAKKIKEECLEISRDSNIINWKLVKSVVKVQE